MQSSSSNRRRVFLAGAVAGSAALCPPAAGDDAADAPGDAWVADPAAVERAETRRPGFLFREAGVPGFRLPDPLEGVADGGWEQRRRALLEAFRRSVHGHRPEAIPAARFDAVETRDRALGGTAVLQRIRAVLEVDGREFAFSFVVALPIGRSAPRPGAVVLINHRSAPSLDGIEAGGDGFWPAREILARGHAAAAVAALEVDPDRPDGYEEGVRGFLAGGRPPLDDDWRTLSAWAWGAGVVAGFLADSGHVDPARVAVAGHSRGGKAALWAAAEDTRFDVAFANGSGCGGAALSRRRFGETIGRVTGRFPHWFVPAFAGFEGREQELPFDQHTLISLVAPRGVYVSSACEDLWADPRGEYLSLVHAAPVYERLGVDAVSHPTPPPPGEPRVRGATGYHIRSGGHDLTATDWALFLGFLDHRWGPPAEP